MVTCFLCSTKNVNANFRRADFRKILSKKFLHSKYIFYGTKLRKNMNGKTTTNEIKNVKFQITFQ
jgi:hypothetical protein